MNVPQVSSSLEELTCEHVADDYDRHRNYELSGREFAEFVLEDHKCI
jgi:hypothetical protein